MCGKTSYFHWTWAIRSSRRSNSSGERVVQKRAILRAISRRAAAIASDFRRSFIEQDRRSIKIARSVARNVPSGSAELYFAANSRYKSFSGARSVTYRSLVRIALEARILFGPAMHLAAGRTLHWIHFLDGRGLKCLRIHRETGVNHFSGRRTLDQDAVHTFLARTREPGACPTTCKEGSVTAVASPLADALHLHLHRHRLWGWRHLVRHDEVVSPSFTQLVVERVLGSPVCLPL
jgi:hypothetical protein